jgi:hypothetical protein
MSSTATNGNGNGKAIAKSRTTNTHQSVELPPWMQAIRDGMAGAIKADDLKAIMQKQVEKALDGDVPAAKFVFDQAHKLSSTQGMTVIQNNYYGDDSGPRPDKPTRAIPGSDEKAETMRRRLEAGEPLTRADDAGGDEDDVDLT